MREALYQWMARRAPQARERYEALRRRGVPRGRALPVLAAGALFERKGAPLLGSGRRLPPGGSESALALREPPEVLASRLARYGAVSFDVFDTLLLRQADRPETVFALVGAKLSYPGFAQLREEAERRAREKKGRVRGSGEVTLGEIWAELGRMAAIDPAQGMALELEVERALCRGNPYFLPVIGQLRRRGVPLALLSDMYLPGAFLEELLEEQGFGRFSLCLVSGEAGASKGEGGLFRLWRGRRPPGDALAHVGDNPLSDGARAREQGIGSFLYEGVHSRGEAFRAGDMSCLVGSLYRGTVNLRLYGEGRPLSPRYEWGFVYGGLFALGYCRFVREQAQALGADRVLFLARDGALLYRLYRELYPQDPRPVYAYWSRLAAAKICAGLLPADFFRRFLTHKADASRSLEEAFRSMELEPLLPGLCARLGCGPQAPLTHKNAGAVEEYLRGAWGQVLEAYAGQRQAAGAYYRQLLEGCSRALAVDIGWAGSGALSLGLAARRLWGLPCQVTGLLAGTNSLYSPERDWAEPQLLSGQLVSYLFSQGHNRDLWKFHSPRRGHNLFFELLLGSPEGSLRGFYPEGEGFRLEFLPNPHSQAAEEIHRGALDFAREWVGLEERLGLRLPISGRDAYAPMLEALAPQNGPFRRAWEEYLDGPDVG